MAVERELELLDDYLTNRLNGEEKEIFQKQIERDPTLKSEYELQQKLIQGIRNARVAELKSMLNNTVIPPVSHTALLTKAASWIIIAGILGTGVYFLLDHHEKVPIIILEQPIVSNNTQNNVGIVPSTNLHESVAKTATDVQPKNQPIINVKKDAQKPVADSNDAVTVVSGTKTIDRQKPEVFDPNETESNSPLPVNKDVKVESTSKKLVAPSIEVETNSNNKKYGFHYQFKDGKLLLYGSFEKNLYEIMEFFSGNKRTVFLFYKENYFLLNENNEKIRPLISINDPVLLQKLKEHRGDN